MNQLSEFFNRLTGKQKALIGTVTVAAFIGVMALVTEQVDHRRQRWDVPDHRHRPILRMQRQRNLVLLGQRVDRGPAGCIEPVVRDALLALEAGDRMQRGAEHDSAQIEDHGTQRHAHERTAGLR